MDEKLKNELKALQEIVDELKAKPQFKQYVEQRKLSLIDSRLGDIDKLLIAGLLN